MSYKKAHDTVICCNKNNISFFSFLQKLTKKIERDSQIVWEWERKIIFASGLTRLHKTCGHLKEQKVTTNKRPDVKIKTNNIFQTLGGKKSSWENSKKRKRMIKNWEWETRLFFFLLWIFGRGKFFWSKTWVKLSNRKTQHNWLCLPLCCRHWTCVGAEHTSGRLFGDGSKFLAS